MVNMLNLGQSRNFETSGLNETNRSAQTNSNM